MEQEAFSEPVVKAGERIWTRWDTRRTAAAAAALVAGAAVAKHGVPELEADLFRLVNGLPDIAYRPMWVPMQLGSLAGGVAGAIALGAATKRLLVGSAAVGGVVSAWIAAKVVKDLVQRARPIDLILDAVVRDGSRAGLGYASGHTAVAFALYSVAAPHLGRGWRAVALGLATTVGVARIFVGAHLPLDVVGGAGIGLILGESFRALESVAARRRSARATG